MCDKLNNTYYPLPEIEMFETSKTVNKYFAGERYMFFGGGILGYLAHLQSFSVIEMRSFSQDYYFTVETKEAKPRRTDSEEAFSHLAFASLLRRSNP